MPADRESPMHRYRADKRSIWLVFECAADRGHTESDADERGLSDSHVAPAHSRFAICPAVRSIVG
jgi:hypothetical protein